MPWISVAPVHVVVGVREESYHERYRKDDKLVDGEEITWPAPYWYVDSGSLFMLLQLAALDEGLGTGIYGVAGEDVAQLKALLRLPDDIHFVCVVTIGKRPAQEDSSRARLAPLAGPAAARRTHLPGALGRLSACSR